MNRAVGQVSYRLEAQHLRRRHAGQDFEEPPLEHLPTAVGRELVSELEQFNNFQLHATINVHDETENFAILVDPLHLLLHDFNF